MNPLPKDTKVRADGGSFRRVSQRGYFVDKYASGHFVSCMFASLAAVLARGGLDFPTPRFEADTPPENFVYTLHKASGAPLTSGSSMRHSQLAIRRLFPYGAGVKFGRVTDAGLFQLLAEGNTVRIALTMGKVPRPLRRWAGYGFAGGHAGYLSDVREVNGVTEVYWFDPMGKPWRPYRYRGEWEPWESFRTAVFRSDGKIIGTWMKNGEVEKGIMDELARRLEAQEKVAADAMTAKAAAENRAAALQAELNGERLRLDAKNAKIDEARAI
jgi:hypothetical protein